MGDSTSRQSLKGLGVPMERQFMLPQYGGKVYVDKHKNSIVKMLSVPVQEQDIFVRTMTSRIQLNHPNLAQFKGLRQLSIQSSPICTSPSKSYRLQYQLLTYNVFHQIQRYCKLKQPIPELQICRIFQSVVLCLNYLRSKNTLHGDIKVSSIYFDKNRNIKLLDSFMFKDGKTNYQVVMQDPKSMSLLSPQQLQLLRIKLFDSLQSIVRNEMFMVGLSMLQATTIRQGLKGYNLDQLTINQQFFINAMSDIQDCGYSYQLSNLIMNCVHKMPNQRPNYSQFIEQINRIKRNGLTQSYHHHNQSQYRRAHLHRNQPVNNVGPQVYQSSHPRG